MTMKTKERKHRRSTQKVYYEHPLGAKDRRPLIRLSGKYLAGLGFNIGDTVSISIKPGRIVISNLS